ncbi:MAG TPA: cytochrome P450 [Polyangiaceae bacterium]|nr:cytochrome P450 [Polyangiaceae bacterium]
MTLRLDALATKGGGDLVTEFAELIPSDVIGGILGVEPADRPRLGRCATEFLVRDRGEIPAPARAIAALETVKEFFIALRKGRDESPQDDLITHVSQARVRKARLSDQDYGAMCATIAMAGYETTTHLITHALVELFRHADQRERLAEEPTGIPNAVKEVVRYRTPVPIIGRMATRDVHLHDTTIPRGAAVLLIAASAARDERHYSHPERFDIRRDDPDSPGFGQGRHTCFGAPLARLEARVVLEEVLRRFPRYELDESSMIPTGPGDTSGFRRVLLRLDTP